MKKTALKSLALKAVSVAIVAVSMANVANAADWTPYLKGIQHNCNYEALAKDLMAKKVPANLKADVVKQTAKHRKIRKEYWADKDIASIQLKNATAFGAPLQKISYKSVGGEGSVETEYVLHFTNANFIKALPTFTINVNGKAQPAGQKRVWERGGADDENRPYKEVPYRKIKVNTDGYEYETYQTSDDYGEFIVSAPNGWESEVYGGPGTIESLFFDSKNKTITCYGRYM